MAGYEEPGVAMWNKLVEVYQPKVVKVSMDEILDNNGVIDGNLLCKYRKELITNQVERIVSKWNGVVNFYVNRERHEEKPLQLFIDSGVNYVIPNQPVYTLELLSEVSFRDGKFPGDPGLPRSSFIFFNHPLNTSLNSGYYPFIESESSWDGVESVSLEKSLTNRTWDEEKQDSNVRSVVEYEVKLK